MIKKAFQILVVLCFIHLYISFAHKALIAEVETLVHGTFFKVGEYSTISILEVITK